ncbi:MAG TPA: cytochrome P450 [Candidatus Dormibacteraeota bacterium]|nr:cytochrome P450 [Candidatus Dormibacteraeota bacterium]
MNKVDVGTMPSGDLLLLLQHDPYPFYEQLRSAGPVVWATSLGRWLVTGHAEVVEVLRDERFSADRRRWEGFAPVIEPGREGGRSMLVADPPDHTRLRTLVQKAFTPRMVERLRPRIETLVEEALNAAGERGGMDLVADLAYPLPVTVIAELLGVPVEDRAAFRRWSDALVGALDPVAPANRRGAVLAARDALHAYLRQVIAERRADPRDDLISRLVEAEEQGDRLSGPELLAMGVLLLVAGHETTVNLISNGVNALLNHPDQLARLHREPELIEPAVEELLRYDSPVQLTGRVALEALELGGQRVEPGQMVTLMLGAANRDPRVFADPGRLDLGRDPNPHLAFGRGIHFCLGAPLARLEGQIAIGALIRRFPGLRLAGVPERRPTVTLRGFVSLPLAW